MAASPPLASGDGGSASLVSAQGVELRWVNGGAPILRDLTFALQAGERVALMGGNGSGKTALLWALAGLLHPASGRLDVARPTALVVQDPDHARWTSSVEEEIRFALSCAGAASFEAVDPWLEKLELAPLRARDPATLSGGELQRLQLAAALVTEPRTLLLDEPTSFLDPAGATRVETAITSLPPATALVVRATHDTAVALAGTRVLVLHAGRIALDGPPEIVLRDPRLEEWGIDPP